MATDRSAPPSSGPLALVEAPKPTLEGRSRTALTLIGLAVVVALVGAPLVGWPRVVRLPAVVVPALALALLSVPRRDWGQSPLLREGWQPSRRVLWAAALVVGAFLAWYVLTRFRSGEINAIDFTVYYDRPCAQTVRGRPLFVETSDTPGFSQRSELADHAYWGMLLVCAPYALHASPLWLHALSVIAIVGGARHVFRITQQLGAGGALAAATALAFVLNDNTARTLNYGFHPEVLYAWFIPWMIDAGLAGRRRSFVLATLACVLVKEDACLPLFAASVALALHRFRSLSRSDRVLFLVFPTALALGNLWLFYGHVVPLLSGATRPTYAHFWGNYGETPMAALLGMITHPWTVLKSAVSSGVIRTLAPLLFLPLLGWRWTLGTLPIAALYGASANEQVRAFAIYYAIVLVPFFVLAASAGALTLARRLVAGAGPAQAAAGALMLLGPLLVGSSHRGYSLRPWKPEIAAVSQAVAELSAEPRVLVQSGLFPHAGYDERLALLTPEALDDPRNAGAALLLARHVDAYPLPRGEVAWMTQLPALRSLPGGLVAVRLTPEVAHRPRSPLFRPGGPTRPHVGWWEWGRPRGGGRRRWRSRERRVHVGFAPGPVP